MKPAKQVSVVAVADLAELRASLASLEARGESARLQAALGPLLKDAPDEPELWDRCARTFQLDPRQRRDHAVALFDFGYISRSLAMLRDVGREDKLRQSCIFLEVRFLHALEAWPDALAIVERAVAESAGGTDADPLLGLRAQHHLRAGMYEEAVADFTLLSLRRPCDVQAYQGLVKAFCATRAFDAARAVLALTRERVPDEAAHLAVEATIVRASGTQDELLEFCVRLIGGPLPDAEVVGHVRRLLAKRAAVSGDRLWAPLIDASASRPRVREAMSNLRNRCMDGGVERSLEELGRQYDALGPRRHGIAGIVLLARRAALLVGAKRETEAEAAADTIEAETLGWPAVPAQASQLIEWRHVRCGRIEFAQSLYWSRRRRIRVVDRSSELAEVTAGPSQTEVVVFAQIRNELVNLPRFLDHHRGLGVRKFVMVDNGSTDGSLEYLSDMTDVQLFATNSSYRRANAGSDWLDPMMRRTEYAGVLCLRLDADEHLVYPHCDRASVHDLWRYMRRHTFGAISGPMVDLYPETAAQLRSMTDPREDCRYFDGDILMRPSIVPPFFEASGGVRSRSLGGKQQNLSKVPGLPGGGAVERLGSHRCSPVTPADISCALLHYKFRPGFFERAHEEIARREYAMNGQEWERYLELEELGDASLLAPGTRKFSSWVDLVAAGLMRSSTRWARFVERLD